MNANITEENTSIGRVNNDQYLVFILFVSLYILAMFDVPKIIIWLYNIPLSVFYPFFPHLAPFCLIILYYNMTARSDSKHPKISIATADVLVLTLISTLFLMEMLHSTTAGKFDLTVVISYFWVFFFMISLSTFDYVENYKYIISLITVSIISVLSVLQIASYLNIGLVENIPAFEIFRDTPGQLFVAESSYRSTLCVCIILFSIKWRDICVKIQSFFVLCLLVNILLVIMNASRGGVLILLIFCIILFSTVFMKCCRHIYAWIRSSFGAFAIIILASLTSLALALDGWLIYENGPTVQQLAISTQEVLFFGRGFVDDESTELRVQTTMLAADAFLENPIFGIGYGAFLTDRLHGMVSHTHLVNVFTAYGLIGGVLTVASVIGLASERGRLLSAEKIALLVVLLSPLAIVPEVRWWYAIPLYFLRRAGPDPAVPAARTTPLQT